MTQKYLERLNKLADNKTLMRKISYIKYNLAKYINTDSKKTLVLEIGPGLGELISYLNSYNIFNIDIIDNDKSVVGYIEKKFKIRKALILKDIVTQEKKLDTYDLVVMIQVLEHIPISLHEKILNVLYSHLNKNGIIIIVVPNANNPLGLVERYADTQHTIAFTTQSVNDLVNKSNLKNYTLEIKGYEIPPYELINILRKVLQKILHLILVCLLIVNGGVYFKTMTPNLMIVIKKN